jgi:hypothetical protein
MLAAERLGAARPTSHGAWVDQRLAALTPAVSAVLRDCLALEPQLRPSAAALATRLRAMLDGETLEAWTARQLAEQGGWLDSAFDVPVTRLPEPSPADPTYYLPDPTRPRPEVVPDLTDPGFTGEDVASEQTAPSDGTLRAPFADESAEVQPRSRPGARAAIAVATVAALVGAVYAFLPRTEAADAALVAPDPIVEHDTPPPAGVPSVVFTSAALETVRVTVHCSGASAHGATMASVPVDAAGTCTVTAILADRDRISAVVSGAAAGRYRCFVEGSATCQPE